MVVHPAPAGHTCIRATRKRSEGRLPEESARMYAKSHARPITLIILAAAVLFSSSCFAGDLGEESSEGGQSFAIDDQFVIIWNGHEAGRVTYVVVRNWPGSASPEDRLADKRLVLAGVEKPKVRLQDGSYRPVADTPHLYFYDGDNLTSFPIAMQESDLGTLRPEALTSFQDLLRFFRTYETK